MCIPMGNGGGKGRCVRWKSRGGSKQMRSWESQTRMAGVSEEFRWKGMLRGRVETRELS